MAPPWGPSRREPQKDKISKRYILGVTKVLLFSIWLICCMNFRNIFSDDSHIATGRLGNYNAVKIETFLLPF